VVGSRDLSRARPVQNGKGVHFNFGARQLMKGKQISRPCNFGGKVGKTTAVDRYPKGASPYGALDMAGNVWEWTATKWLENYANYANVVDNDPEADASAGALRARVVRGGSWLDDQYVVRAADRRGDSPGVRYYRLGFRVVVAVASR